MFFRHQALLVLLGTSSQLAFAVVVTLPTGAEIVGTLHGDARVESFLGIQYAEVGGRFSRSTLVDTSSDVDATAFGPNCHQVYVGLPDWLHTPRDEDEECLYLNVWRPIRSSDDYMSDSLTTMVWIHGGGFALGSGADDVHNGANLARDQNVIVVGINYRLGALGFLPRDDIGTGGMNGLYDQIMALRWVNKFIESFGGDGKKVTIFGESAGGESVCMLSVSPLARGLFQRTIQQSGECVNNMWASGVPTDDTEFGTASVAQLLNITGASSISDLADSSRFPAKELNIVSAQVGWPIIMVDQEVLPAHPRALYEDPKNIVPVDMLVGSNSYEGVFYFGQPPAMYQGMAAGSPEFITGMIEPVYGSEVALEVIEAYSPDHYAGDAIQAFTQFTGDYYIRCPAREFASNAAGAVGGSVYLYNFAHFSVTDPVVRYGLENYTDTSEWASHLADLPFIFGTLDFWTPSGRNVTSADRAMSAEIQARWAVFAKTGSPNVEGFAVWNEVPPSDQAHLDRATDVSTMLFASGTSQMENVTSKVDQCSSFPFTLASPTDTPAPSMNPSESDTSTSGSASSLSERFSALFAVVMVASCSFAV